MADFSGIAFSTVTTHQNGRATPNFDYRGDFASLAALVVPYSSGTRTAGNPGSAATGQNQLAGREWPEGTVGFDWFERVHVLPRTKMQFGLVVTTVTRTYELFNAFRHSNAVLNTVAINVGAGVSLPLLPTPPASLAPFTSFKDPSSTRALELPIPLGGGPGMVKLVVSVGPDGPPTFDGTIDFTFGPGGVVSLSLSGQRVAFLSPRYEAPLVESMAFLTDVIEAVDGKEQRIALRKNPRQGLEVTYLLDLTERQRFQNLLMEWQGNAFAVPVWHEELFTTAAASASATSVSVQSTANVDLRVGGMGVVFESPTKFDVIVISAVTSTTVSFTTTPLTFSYSAGASVVPVRVAFLVDAVRGGRAINNLERFEASFLVDDNDTGALTADTTGWSTYLGKVLLDDCNVLDSEIPFELSQRVTRVDSATGVVSQSSRWDKNKRVHQKGFGAHDRAEITKLKRLLLALRGRQKSFWIPTFIDDLTVVANLTSGSSTMDVENVGYVRFVQNREPKRTFKITFTDGTSAVRVVQSSTLISATVERLTLDTTWGSTKTPAEVRRVQFYELVRFDADELNLEFKRAGNARLLAPVRQVFD